MTESTVTFAFYTARVRHDPDGTLWLEGRAWEDVETGQALRWIAGNLEDIERLRQEAHNSEAHTTPLVRVDAIHCYGQHIHSLSSGVSGSLRVSVLQGPRPAVGAIELYAWSVDAP